MQEMPKAKNHTVKLDNRGKLVMTGTEDVSGFNEETVSVKTSCGCLVIKGELLVVILHMLGMSLDILGGIRLDPRKENVKVCQVLGIKELALVNGVLVLEKELSITFDLRNLDFAYQ